MPWTKQALEQALGISLSSIKWTALLTHVGPHFDEILACTLLRSRYGNRIFPEIRNATVNFVSHNEISKLDWRTLMLDGVIPVGICGSLFDEHALNRDATEKQCSASLAWNFLNIPAHLPLHEMVEYVRMVDTTHSVDFRAETGAPFFWHWADMAKEAKNNEASDQVYFDHLTNIILAEAEMRTRTPSDRPVHANHIPEFNHMLIQWAEKHQIDTSIRIMKKLQEYGGFFATDRKCRRLDKFGFHPAALLARLQHFPNLNQQTRFEVLSAIKFFLQQAAMGQQRFDLALAVFDQAVKDTPRQRGLALVCLSHSNPDLHKAMKFRKCRGVLVQHNPRTDEIAVFWNTGSNFPVDRLVADIRHEEMKEMGHLPGETDDLAAMGNVAGWYRLNGNANYLLWRCSEQSKLDRESFRAIFNRIMR